MGHRTNLFNIFICKSGIHFGLYCSFTESEDFPTVKNDMVMELLGQSTSWASSWFLFTLYFSGNRQKDGVDHICPEPHLIFEAECKTE